MGKYKNTKKTRSSPNKGARMWSSDDITRKLERKIGFDKKVPFIEFWQG